MPAAMVILISVVMVAAFIGASYLQAYRRRKELARSGKTRPPQRDEHHQAP